MKLGILTYHRAQNYGALLQAIALRKILSQWGYMAFYVDYFPDYHRKLYKTFTLPELLQKRWRYILEYPSRLKRYNLFKYFISKEIEPYCRSVSEDYDVVIYGSDQIWRRQPFVEKFNPVYFAENSIKATKHAAYSASMGEMKMSDAERKELSLMLKRFDRISVREKVLVELVRQLGREDVVETLDPTLLLTRKDWETILPPATNIPKSKYLLYFEIRQGFNEGAVSEFAKQKGLDVIRISANKVNDVPGARKYENPYDFVNLVKNADFVCTSSFHCLVFSIIYGKAFYTAFSSNAERALSLQKQLGLQDYLLDPHLSQLPDYQPYSTSDVNVSLGRLRMESLNYLQSVIQE